MFGLIKKLFGSTPAEVTPVTTEAPYKVEQVDAQPVAKPKSNSTKAVEAVVKSVAPKKKPAGRKPAGAKKAPAKRAPKK